MCALETYLISFLGGEEEEVSGTCKFESSEFDDGIGAVVCTTDVLRDLWSGGGDTAWWWREMVIFGKVGTKGLENGAAAEGMVDGRVVNVELSAAAATAVASDTATILAVSQWRFSLAWK